jgi:phosphoribosyl 1,2-cyclic phosphate phosphodiesterase
MKGTFTFLGTGGSVGVPMVGCDCAVCRSDLPFNKRLRSSALLTVKQKKILIDAGPDFREQALRQGISSLDGVIFTHAHHDHSAGIDDLRPLFYNRHAPLPVLLSKYHPCNV